MAATQSKIPLISSVTRAQSESIETVLNRMRSKRVVIPDYQRDAEQWDLRKQSLLVESILNKLTMPAFFFAENVDTSANEVVDGQQRLDTIRKYYEGEFAMSDDAGMVYLTPHSVQYRGKKFDELDVRLQNIFLEYPLTIIYLPQGIDLSTKLEIFRRINEGGTPLTAQDIRLAYYSASPSVALIRLAGIYADTKAAIRMREAAKKMSVSDPWQRHKWEFELWSSWWLDKRQTRGQTPSEMFLWYLVSRYRDNLAALLDPPDQMKHLSISFRGSTEEVLDIYCDQLRWTDEHGGPQVFPTYQQGLQDEFAHFASWIGRILGRGIAGLSVDKYKQAALFIAALVELGLKPPAISEDAWDAFAEFMRTPRKAGSKWLTNGGYPEQRGRWGGQKGQKAQCDSVVKLVRAVLAKHPS